MVVYLGVVKTMDRVEAADVIDGLLLALLAVLPHVPELTR